MDKDKVGSSETDSDLATHPVFIDVDSQVNGKPAKRHQKGFKSLLPLGRLLNRGNAPYKHQKDDIGTTLDDIELTGTSLQVPNLRNGHVLPAAKEKGEDSSGGSGNVDWTQRKAMLGQFSREYAYLAGCHGAARGAQKNASWLRRSFWFILSCAALSTLFWQTSLLINQFRSYEFQADVEFSFNRELAFPAVTFCNLSPLKESALRCSRFDDDTYNNVSACYSNTTDSPGDTVNISTGGSTEHQFNFSGEPITSQEYLDYGFLPKDVIISCTWNGMPCSESNFTVSQNPYYGNCFTLNGDRADPLVTNRPGTTAGLSLELFVDPKEGVGPGDTSTSTGVRMSLHRPGVKPFPEEDGFSLPTGYSSNIGVRQLEVNRLGSPYSNCTPETADWRSLYPGYLYSRTACVQSCLAQVMFDRCGCVDTYLVGKPICRNANVDESQASCVEGVRDGYRRNEVNCAECFNPCIDRLYLYTLSVALWPSAGYQYLFLKKLAAQNKTGDYIAPERFRENYLRAEVYFEELNYQRIVQKPAYPAENLLADIGGQMGLWAGLSVLGFVEFFDFLGQFMLVLLGLKKVKMS